MTYADLARRIAATHLLFKECGVKRGDKIALMGRNSISWVETYMATITYGAVIVPVLHDFNVQDAMHIINHSESVMLFTNESIFDNMEFEKIPAIKAVLSLDKREVLAEHPTNNHVVKKFLVKLPDRMRKAYPHGFTSADVEYPELDESSLAEINYTSGTTGFSKGVMLTLRNLGGNVRFGIESRLHYRGSRNVSFLPLAHAYGCAFDMLTPLAAGSHITVLGRTPSPAVLLGAFAEVKPHLILCVPLVLEKIYRKRILPAMSEPKVRRMLAMPGLRHLVYRKLRARLTAALGGCFKEVVVGGAALSNEVEEFLHSIKFPFTVGYGMTECAPLIAYAPWDEQRPGSCGRVVDRMECRVDSADPSVTPGVLWVRGDNVMAGYFRNPEATKAVMADDGWMNTGDICSIDSDGFIYIRGRDKTMILGPSGQNIYPEEIEQKLNNLPYVAESLVIDEDGKLVALIYPDFDLAHSQHMTDEQVEDLMAQNIKQLNSELPSYSQIARKRIFHEEFEKTPKRSIKRYLYQH